MKSRLFGLLLVFAASGVFGIAQAVKHPASAKPISMSDLGAFEPPEMRKAAEITPVPTPPAADAAFYEAITKTGKAAYDPTSIPILDKFLREYPTYANAYFWRGNIEAYGDNPLDIPKAKADFEAALSHREDANSLFEEKDVLPILAKIEDSEGHYAAAISLLEKAMMADLSSADKIFNSQGIAPETTSKFCSWNLSELHKLESSAPRDWRPVAFEGLYYRFFTTFNESYYPQATGALQKAALLNPKTPVVPYLQGELHMKSAFWTKKSWSSDAARNQMYRNAIPFFTKAIDLDHAFEPAYASRAEAYLESKQDALAIKDYTKVLSLEPDNSAAYSDRGLANVNVGQYYAAISDFGDAVRLKHEGNSYLPNLYENRADAYVKVQDYRRAIDNYSTAIELHLKNQVLLLSLQQFRGIYPEYGAVSDDVLLKDLHRRFGQQLKEEDFRKMLTVDNGKWGVSFLFQSLYEKRGNTYLSIGDYIDGIEDFQRIFVGMPEYEKSTERWRSIGSAVSGEKYYIDVKASVSVSAGYPRIWVKSVETKKSAVMAFELNCSSRKYRVTSNVFYDQNGNPSGDSDVSELWSDVIPDTLGEQIWGGVCERKL